MSNNKIIDVNGNVYANSLAVTNGLTISGNIEIDTGEIMITGNIVISSSQVPNVVTLSNSGNINAINVITSGYSIRSVGTGIIALGNAQSSATALTKEINLVSTVLLGNGVVLPTAVAGMVVIIINTSANTLSVYPASGAQINSGEANAAHLHPAGATLQYVAPTTTNWYTSSATFA